MNALEAGMIGIIGGLALLIGQFFIDSNEPKKTYGWTGKQQKMRMIVGGIGLFLLGLIVLIFGKH
jgi:hypothetical protein